MSTNSWITQWRQFLSTHPQLNLPEASINLSIPNQSINDLASNEDFWHNVQSLFPKPENHSNLNNGGVCSNAIHVELAYTKLYSILNSSPSYFTWKIMEQAREIVKQGLASMINSSSDEIAIFRNATEALNNAIFGIQLQVNDEVVVCKQDYIKCVSSWKQRELREGIKLNWVEIFGTETNEEVIEKYLNAITPQTKVLHLTHIINWNGQILPVVEISREAKKRGLIVLLDAAHSFAVLETDVEEIQCDYLGAALHKWLSGPIAAGMLYVRKNMITNTYPLASAINPLSDKIAKFEEMSILVLPNLVALGYAIEFHLMLSRELKIARLTHLRKRWTDALQHNSNIHFNVPLNDTQCKAIANFNIQGKDPIALEQEIFNRFNIHVVGFLWPNLSGIRITPNIYTRIEEMDELANAVLLITNEV